MLYTHIPWIIDDCLFPAETRGAHTPYTRRTRGAIGAACAEVIFVIFWSFLALRKISIVFDIFGAGSKWLTVCGGREP